MGAITNVDKQCPVCKLAGHKGVYRAFAPLVVKGKVLDPHTYAICYDCLKQQWYEVYGEDMGKTYDEYLADKAASRNPVQHLTN